MKAESKKSLVYTLLLVLTAIIWGAAFVAQSVGMDNVGPYTFNCLRFFLGVIVLVPVILIKDGKTTTSCKWNNPKLIKASVVCGIFLFLASSTQQIGIMYTSVGKSGFITAFYIVLVPIFSIFLKKKPSILIWISVILGIIGLYFLCIKDESFSISKGDPYLFACAILFSCQILAIDMLAPEVDSLKLSCLEFLVAGILGLVPMFIEGPTLSGIMGASVPLMYAGFLSCGVAYTLQVVTQKHVKPAVASLVMSLESVFSVLFGFIILKQVLSLREILGCAIMFAAVILSQFEPGKK